MRRMTICATVTFLLLLSLFVANAASHTGTVAANLNHDVNIFFGSQTNTAPTAFAFPEAATIKLMAIWAIFGIVGFRRDGWLKRNHG